jgi:hypothetical protein
VADADDQSALVVRACVACAARWLWLGSPHCPPIEPKPPHGGVKVGAAYQMSATMFGKIFRIPLAPLQLPPHVSSGARQERVKGWLKGATDTGRVNRLALPRPRPWPEGVQPER